MSFRSFLPPAATAVAVAMALVACNEPAIQVPEVSTAVAALASADLAAPLEPAPGSCNIEAVDGVAFGDVPLQTVRQTVVIGGWLHSEYSHGSDIQASLRLVGADGAQTWSREIVAWSARPDVMAARGEDYRSLPGFQQAMDLGPLAPGKYRLVVVFSDSGSTYVCDKGREVQLQ
ncbi:hypothetical protein J2X06_002427 [Lysobacter niastensis]|uniref:Lipoprotein n=1 Tax=Lysobacter niastensis TaxID=380629 RepID=A0ABU1WC95_9GAMM|nr:hypothetical protein [Lysobacter niastensis]MDR7135218.1 hypothetical protein [Lysobacter niastensis]